MKKLDEIKPEFGGGLRRSLNPVFVERFKGSRVGRNMFLVGFAAGLVPYFVHIYGWLR